MLSNQLKRIIAASKVVVHKGRYAYLKMRKTPAGTYFMVAKDSDEITIVAEEKQLGGLTYESAIKWFKLIEFRVAKPFVSTGFLAKISQAIAQRGINLLIVSTFSKDYVLVREERVNDTVAALRKAGFPIKGEKPKIKSMFGAAKGLGRWTKADRADFREL
ncbi:ACT domain-containing protein [Candidatus Woesearchaeota archaeon]|nr:ACT domain-containing protein [Candidatus Woesearchaeota archaeon]